MALSVVSATRRSVLATSFSSFFFSKSLRDDLDSLLQDLQKPAHHEHDSNTVNLNELDDLMSDLQVGQFFFVLCFSPLLLFFFALGLTSHVPLLPRTIARLLLPLVPPLLFLSKRRLTLNWTTC